MPVYICHEHGHDKEGHQRIRNTKTTINHTKALLCDFSKRDFLMPVYL